MDDVRTRLQSALRRYPAAVTVISARAPDGTLLALTATAVTVLTLDPPTMLACVNRTTAFASAFAEVPAFTINVLSDGQSAVSNACAGQVPQGQREGAAGWRSGPLEAPLLEGALANIVCRKQEIAVPGGHSLILGEVVEVFTADGVDPLIYLDRAYGGFAPLAAG